jgi:excinuclease UvrABC helicase subunit UvrB
VIAEAGIIMEDMEKESLDENEESTFNKGVTKTSLDVLDLDTLEDLLQEAIDNEDYQKAAQIRDEINRRK